MIPFVEEIVTEIDLEEQRAVIDPAARPDRRPGRGRLLRATSRGRGRRGRRRRGTTPDAARRRHDLPRVPGTAERLPRRQGTRARTARRARPRPAGVDVRPAQHGRRHPVRRRPRHGHEDRALGRRPGLSRSPTATSRARTARSSSSPRPAAAPSPRNSPSSSPSGPGWSSPRPATRASTAGSSTSTPPGCPVYEVSIGDYVLAGGEAAVLVITEAVARLLPGVLGNAESHRDDSFAPGAMANLLEGPVYTKPPEWRGRGIPDVLLSGHHGKIARWRRDEALRRTAAQPARPDRALRAQRPSTRRTARCSPSWAGRAGAPTADFGAGPQAVEE